MQSLVLLVCTLCLVNVPAICHGEGNNGRQDTTDVQNSGPEADKMRWVIGAGVSIRFDDIEDFKYPTADDDYIRIDVASRIRTSVFSGAMFGFGEKTRWNVLVSAKFEIGKSTKSLDGFLLGFGYCFDKNVALAVSYDLRRGRELRPSFRREAASLVAVAKQCSKCAALSAKYRSFVLNSSCDDLKDGKQFDGFPLRHPKTNKILGSSSDPFVDSYNSALHLGIMFAHRVDVKSLFPPD